MSKFMIVNHRCPICHSEIERIFIDYDLILDN